MTSTRRPGYKRTALLVTLSTAAVLLTACHEDPTPGVESKPVWSRPLPKERWCLQYEAKALVDSSGDTVQRYDPATGKVMWSYKAPNQSCPRATKQAVYSAGDGRINAIDPATGKPLWTAITSDPKPAVTDGYEPVATTSHVHTKFDGQLRAVDLTTHKVAWRRWETDDVGMERIAADGNTLITVTANGKVRALNGSDGKPLWTYATPSAGSILAEPVIVGGSVYVSSADRHLYAISLTTGRLQWRTKLHADSDWRVAVRGNTLFTADSQYLYGLETKTGRIRWEIKSDDHQYLGTAPGQVLYTRPKSKEIRSLNPTSGDTNWTLPLSDKDAYFATSDTHLFIQDGKHISAHKFTNP
ncbi:PQQ-binding-like beta-propeller repeat protein [Streptomyces sp. NPDC007883]|uniref:PQQ-binding-like beta-propeller repeat protein n=1 Tax=Streptomyces sp. NPDC007883 TaxID=3155116 RepID=UPI0033D09310